MIKNALDDPHVRAPRTLSLMKRARKLCEASSKSVMRSKSSKQRSKQTKKVDEYPSYDLSDFPEMDLITAPEVSNYFPLLCIELMCVCLADCIVVLLF